MQWLLSGLDPLSLIMICLRLKYMRFHQKKELESDEKANNIISEGAMGSEMFIILPGSAGICKVVKKDDKGVTVPIGLLYEGDFFGESAILVPHGPRGVRPHHLPVCCNRLPFCDRVFQSDGVEVASGPTAASATAGHADTDGLAGLGAHPDLRASRVSPAAARHRPVPRDPVPSTACCPWHLRPLDSQTVAAFSLQGSALQCHSVQGSAAETNCVMVMLHVPSSFTRMVD